MAMTGSSIGGKLGIDFLGVKNNIGVFGRAKGIFPDPVFLKTLPERELRSGFAEVANHAIIGDPGLWQLLQQVNSCTEMDWNLVLPRSMAVKQHIMHLDPKEKNLRKLLNFGHTIGHALESHFLRTDTPMLHGEAVAWGVTLLLLAHPLQVEGAVNVAGRTDLLCGAALIWTAQARASLGVVVGTLIACGAKELGVLAPEARRDLSFKGKVKGFAHSWRQAVAVREADCEACGLCVKHCPEGAIKLVSRGA